ncbi:MAG: DUF971 domain-containing protein [Acidobacteriota bacterium]|nr:DUF971 domain-containing protein [Acidobacteriota bacterium]
MSSPLPTEIRRLPEDKRLRITWSDGHVAEYEYDFLRGYCPCAGCQGHSVAEVRYQPPSVSVTATKIEPVGNYAISILWSDSHATGIYRFDFLREICPCDPCRAARKSGESPN